MRKKIETWEIWITKERSFWKWEWVCLALCLFLLLLHTLTCNRSKTGGTLSPAITPRGALWFQFVGGTVIRDERERESSLVGFWDIFITTILLHKWFFFLLFYFSFFLFCLYVLIFFFFGRHVFFSNHKPRTTEDFFGSLSLLVSEANLFNHAHYMAIFVLYKLWKDIDIVLLYAK